MKAIVARRYGGPDVLDIVDAEDPELAPDEVLVRVTGSSVNPLDWHVMRGKPYLVRAVHGLKAPRRASRGTDVAGVVVSVGKDVTRFVVDDRVLGTADGAWAEFVATPERALVHCPDSVADDAAGAVGIAALTALQGLRRGGLVVEGAPERIARGDTRPRVLINGASGGVGTFAVQMAKLLGAHVTAITSTRNLALVSRLGADDLIDYTTTDVTRQVARYDLILDLVVNHSRRALARILTPDGTLVLVGAPRGQWIGPLTYMAGTSLASRFSRQHFFVLNATRALADMHTLAEWLGAGALTVVVDEVYPLERIRDAVAHAETGHARGKVVVVPQGVVER